MNSRNFELELRLKELEESRAQNRELCLAVDGVARKDRDLNKMGTKVDELRQDLERQLGIAKELRIKCEEFKAGREEAVRSRQETEHECDVLRFRLDQHLRLFFQSLVGIMLVRSRGPITMK